MKSTEIEAAVESIYLAAYTTLINSGAHPDDDKAEALLEAIRAYFGAPSD